LQATLASTLATAGKKRHGGTPVAGWLAFENASYKWMMTGGTTILGNPNFNIEAMIVNVSLLK
jgi:hypothetical protein